MRVELDASPLGARDRSAAILFRQWIGRARSWCHVFVVVILSKGAGIFLPSVPLRLVLYSWSRAPR